jgi:hypothetical protein
MGLIWREIIAIMLHMILTRVGRSHVEDGTPTWKFKGLLGVSRKRMGFRWPWLRRQEESRGATRGRRLRSTERGSQFSQEKRSRYWSVII